MRRMRSSDFWQRKVMEDSARAMVRSPNPPRVVYSQYLTYTEGTSYKYHMFIIFEYDEEGSGKKMYVGLNTHGPIEKRMTFFEIARSSNLGLVRSAVYEKERKKRAKGYM